MSLSAKIVQDHLSLFVDLCEAMAGMDILISKDNDKQVKVLEMPIEEMDLSVRSYNCLKRANINTVEDLIKKKNRKKPNQATQDYDIEQNGLLMSE